jgi:hypothetical protein
MGSNNKGVHEALQVLSSTLGEKLDNVDSKLTATKLSVQQEVANLRKDIEILKRTYENENQNIMGYLQKHRWIICSIVGLYVLHFIDKK